MLVLTDIGVTTDAAMGHLDLALWPHAGSAACVIHVEGSSSDGNHTPGGGASTNLPLDARPRLDIHQLSVQINIRTSNEIWRVCTACVFFDILWRGSDGG
jgi:hypothetical protein